MFGSDELDPAHRGLNMMLRALAESWGAQARLVTDADTSCGTPLTSLRTNVELLTPGWPWHPAAAGERDGRMRADVVAQIEELSTW